MGGCDIHVWQWAVYGCGAHARQFIVGECDVHVWQWTGWRTCLTEGNGWGYAGLESGQWVDVTYMSDSGQVGRWVVGELGGSPWQERSAGLIGDHPRRFLRGGPTATGATEPRQLRAGHQV